MAAKSVGNYFEYHLVILWIINDIRKTTKRYIHIIRNVGGGKGYNLMQEKRSWFHFPDPPHYWPSSHYFRSGHRLPRHWHWSGWAGSRIQPSAETIKLPLSRCTFIHNPSILGLRYWFLWSWKSWVGRQSRHSAFTAWHILMMIVC